MTRFTYRTVPLGLTNASLSMYSIGATDIGIGIMGNKLSNSVKNIFIEEKETKPKEDDKTNEGNDKP